MKTFIDFKEEDSNLAINRAKRNLENFVDMFNEKQVEEMKNYLAEWWGWAKGDGIIAINSRTRLNIIEEATKESIEVILSALRESMARS